MTKRNHSERSFHNYVVRIQRIDEDRRVVLGLVYEPNVLDTYGEFMVTEDVGVMAERYLREVCLPESIDTNHDNVPNGSYPVESFIARSGDPDFAEGGWVLGIKVPGDDVWARIKSGDLNGFSFEALVKPVTVHATVETVRDRVGRTEGASAGEDHQHVYFLQVDPLGRVRAGATDEVDGHSHVILRGSYTMPGGPDEHTHRFFI